MTEAGARGNLSDHTLGRLIVSTPVIFEMLSTREVRHLRRADTVLRSLVAEHSWADAVTPVRNLTQWRTSFPAAHVAFVDAATLTKPQCARLSGFTGLGVLGFRCKSGLGNELPLALVRSMPHLESLRVAVRSGLGVKSIPTDIAPSAAVWRELGRLRELRLELPHASYPSDLLSHLGGLHKLQLEATIERGQLAPVGAFLVTDAGLARVPELVELKLRDISFHRGFTGASFSLVPALSVLELHSAHLPRGSLLPTNLQSLSISGQAHLADETLAPLTRLTSLVLDTFGNQARAPGGNATDGCLTSAAFLGLSQLESFNVTRGTLGTSADLILAVLNGFGKLRRLTGNLVLVPSLLATLSRCRLVELTLQQNMDDKAACALPSPVAFARAFPQLRSLSMALTREESADLHLWEPSRISSFVGIAAPFSALQGLRVRAYCTRRLQPPYYPSLSVALVITLDSQCV